MCAPEPAPPPGRPRWRRRPCPWSCRRCSPAGDARNDREERQGEDIERGLAIRARAPPQAASRTPAWRRARSCRRSAGRSRTETGPRPAIPGHESGDRVDRGPLARALLVAALSESCASRIGWPARCRRRRRRGRARRRGEPHVVRPRVGGVARALVEREVLDRRLLELVVAQAPELQVLRPARRHRRRLGGLVRDGARVEPEARREDLAPVLPLALPLEADGDGVGRRRDAHEELASAEGAAAAESRSAAPGAPLPVEAPPSAAGRARRHRPGPARRELSDLSFFGMPSLCAMSEYTAACATRSLAPVRRRSDVHTHR